MIRNESEVKVKNPLQVLIRLDHRVAMAMAFPLFFIRVDP